MRVPELLVAFSVAVSSAAAAAQTPALPPQVVTSASGEARLAPDRATVAVGIQTRASTAAAAARDNSARQQVILSAITAAGIPREQISTENYNVYAETRADRPDQAPTVVGYVVSNVVRVELRRTDQVATVIDAALTKGANQINSLDFYASNPDPARRQALAEAIIRARGDADAMARAAGGRLGPLLELSSADSGPRPMMRMASTERAAMATPIEPGELTVRVSVTARWQFVAGQ
jgi:uncharacterized protein YggE